MGDKKTLSEMGAAAKKGKKGANQHSFPEIKKIARKMLSHPEFRKNLQTKLNDLSLHPSVITTLLYYAHGKPKEELEVKQITPVRIEHHYSDEK